MLPEVSTCQHGWGKLARTEDVNPQRQIRWKDGLIEPMAGAIQKQGVVNGRVQPSPVSMALEEITTAPLAGGTEAVRARGRTQKGSVQSVP